MNRNIVTKLERILIKLCKTTKIIKWLCKLENFRLYR